MKNLTYVILGLFILMGCSDNFNIEEKKYGEVDTLIKTNKDNLSLGWDEDKKSDTFILNKLKKVIYKIDTLKLEIKQLKIENHELKSNNVDTDDVGKPYVLLPISDDQKNW